MSANFNKILGWLKAYKRKYYQNLLIKGGILSSALLLSIFLLFNSLEYTFRLASPFRATLLIIFVVIFLVVIWQWVMKPIGQLLNLQKQLSHEEAAKQIGQYFPNVNDKLLNAIQLCNETAKESTLVQASIAQRSKELSLFNFTDAVNFKDNKRYAKYLAPPILVAMALLVFIPQLFTEGTERIVNFNRNYVPEAPFQFKLNNNDLTAFKNEDFTLNLSFTGDYQPNEAYLVIGGRKVKLRKEGDEFFHTFNNIQKRQAFYFEASGFFSSQYEVNVLSRPNLKDFNIDLIYPEYLKKSRQRLENAGNLLIPEGTKVQWQFSSIDTDSLILNFKNEDASYNLKKTGNQLFAFEKEIFTSDKYEVQLKNENSRNKEEISYTIDVVKDKYPEVTIERFNDTTMYNFLVLGGDISDDYGLTQLKVFYNIDGERQSNNTRFKSISIPINQGQLNQSYYFPWRLDSLSLEPGSKVNYYLQVWDNDGVNGSKSSKTNLYTFKVPSKEEVDKQLKEAANNTKEKLAGSRNDASTLKEELEELENKLKGKKQLEWKDKQNIEEVLKKKEELTEAIEQLKEQNKANNLQQERFGRQNEKIREKAQELQKLMEELLDEETKKLYDELKKLLEEKSDANSIQEQISKINDKESSLEKELERTLELFKRLQFDQKLEDIIQDAEDMAKAQEELSEETTGADKNTSSETLKEKQEELNKDFDDVKQDIQELQELNQDLKNANPMQNTSEEEKEIDDEQQKSSESLEKDRKSKATKHQQKAAEKMKELAKKMEQMQSGMEMDMMEENLDHLRDIVDNLVKLSFNQEALMGQFREVNQSDPRFVKLSQNQLKLKDDAKIIEDSLLSLANRVFQIQSFVTREVESMNNHMDASLEALKERNHPKAIGDQQLAMTSMNNLALLLEDVLGQMQQQMADAMGKPQKGKGKKNSPGLSELQQQLNDKISQLKKSGKTGRALSEELAKLAAEQEQIRRALQEDLKNAGEGGKEGGGAGKQAIEKMEETESDLVNKEITEKTIARQQEILTRLLESDNAMREREQDEKREAEQATTYDQIVPKAFEEYIKAKEKEIELLKTVPPRLNPYYLQEVNEYFKRLKLTNP